MELKTLSRRDPEFDSYLKGTFARDRRALPVQTLNVDTESERVTFQIVPVGEIAEPPFLAKWGQVFRARDFVYVLFPLFLILVKNYFDDVAWDPLLAALAGVGALALSLGAFLMNDYWDHMKGVDRVHPRSGRAIQKGWVTAQATRQWASFYLVLGCALGLPAVFVFPELLFLLTIPGLVAVLSFVFPRIGLKYRRGAEWVVFLMFGPLLTVGYQIAIGGGFDLEALAIGILTGWHFAFLVHVKNFESLVINSQAGFVNTISFLGFERGKRFLALWWAGFIVMMAGYQFVYHAAEWTGLFALLPWIFSTVFFLRLRKMQSPAGSELTIVVKAARTAALLMLLLWALQGFYYGLVAEIGSPS